LPWTLQLLNSKGVNLNQIDSLGATPLHVCAEKNLARPVRMLVDAGADVNVKHQNKGLTPLQVSTSHSSLSFLNI
jgi:ankyrin repeat protein